MTGTTSAGEPSTLPPPAELESMEIRDATGAATGHVEDVYVEGVGAETRWRSTPRRFRDLHGAGYMRPENEPPEVHGAGYMRPENEPPEVHGAGYMRPENEPPEVHGAGRMDPKFLSTVRRWREG